MKKIILFLSLLFLSLSTFSQDSTLKQIERSENKFIYDGNIIRIFSGQKVRISAANKMGKLTDYKLIDTAETDIFDPKLIVINVLKQKEEKYLTFNYNLIKNDDGKFTTYLIVNNPFKGTLRYKAKFYHYRKGYYVETSIMGVMPGICGIETWPYPIGDLVLYDFTVGD